MERRRLADTVANKRNVIANQHRHAISKPPPPYCLPIRLTYPFSGCLLPMP
ncbi:hypothetical protein [Kingella sp. (in: b-proteobacteria)]|uniref:hypothetical protein n=1 Tax=Kingella sp. (in: b-proteobacteria) TaxID=2020713 RepID=UPI0026DCE1AE|nr:hypothetical protein [Kingella sp. (in: b-proteobacteria)]MDO4657875.1 hypothetical protein [Kingella sp. (in: b-proteobacteria)]